MSETVAPDTITVRIKLHDNGPSLWPERFDERALLRIKTTLGTYYFNALYQGRPTPEGGGLFQRSWFKYYKRQQGCFTLGNRSFPESYCRRFGTVDLAFSVKTEADYTVIMAWAVTPDVDLVLLDIHRERMTGEKLVPSIKAMVEKWILDYVGIEDVQAQTLVVRTARLEGITVRALKANMDKITRSIPAQIRMEAGQVWLPENHPELEHLEHELLTFPKGAHDDLVDNVAYASLEVQRLGGAAIPEHERIRLDQERAKREWQERVARDRAAQNDADHPRWWADEQWM
jgi:predicted phage terminase large subunit-like protein